MQKKYDFDHGRRRRTSMIPLENDLQSTAFSPKLQTRNWPSAFDRGSLRQRQPTTINDAAATTLELQSHLSLANTASRPSDIPVDVVHQGRPTQPNGTTRLREQLVSRMEKLRTDPSIRNKPSAQTPRPYARRSPLGRPRFKPRYQQRPQYRQQLSPIVCYRCGQEGHYARGCSTSTCSQLDQGN